MVAVASGPEEKKKSLFIYIYTIGSFHKRNAEPGISVFANDNQLGGRTHSAVFFLIDKLDERIHSLQKMGEMHVMKAGHTRD